MTDVGAENLLVLPSDRVFQKSSKEVEAGDNVNSVV